jgi:hypothetical protein
MCPIASLSHIAPINQTYIQDKCWVIEKKVNWAAQKPSTTFGQITPCANIRKDLKSPKSGTFQNVLAARGNNGRILPCPY